MRDAAEEWRQQKLAKMALLLQLEISGVDFFHVLVHGIAVKNSRFTLPYQDLNIEVRHCILIQDFWNSMAWANQRSLTTTKPVSGFCLNWLMMVSFSCGQTKKIHRDEINAPC